VDTFFEIRNGMVIIYNNSVVVVSGTLCDVLYVIDLIHYLSHFSSSAYFVNDDCFPSVVGILRLPLCCGTNVLDHIFRPRIKRLIKNGIFLFLILVLIVLKGRLVLNLEDKRMGEVRMS